ncbi:hypothetical protein [Methyloversatilis sp.]|uniref:hypothetical protein n=1 Tax=Methyloversatilis sp. TaxID=2569862 RepID=UPI003D2A10EE
MTVIAGGVAAWKWDAWVTIPELRGGVIQPLKDPQSAQFRSEHLGKHPGYLCGEVNAKNSMGGYVGFKRFVSTSQGAVVEGDGLDSWPDRDQDAPFEKLLERVRIRVDFAVKYDLGVDFETIMEESKQSFFDDIWQKHCS